MSEQHLLIQSLVATVAALLFVVSLLGLALGLGLMLKSSATLPFIALLNRWVSTRQALKPLEAPRPVAFGAAVRRWFGVLLAAIGAYAAVVLLGSLDLERLSLLFKVDARPSLASFGLKALKWMLVLGSLAALVTGLMLLFFPHAWRGLEERVNRWYSTHPRAAGSVIFVLSLVAALACGLALFAQR